MWDCRLAALAKLRTFLSFLIVASALVIVYCLTENVLAQRQDEVERFRGEFRGRLVAEWLGDGTRMKLVEPFEYIDSTSRRWSVPVGTVVDGASIPQIFWSIMGAPFSGIYRHASVIHDYYCDARSRPHKDVHMVFYEAMKTAGVNERKAWLMYKAVEQFGPRWETQKVDPRCVDNSTTFDFEYCARASNKPTVKRPLMNRAELQKFYDVVKADADPVDLLTLEAAIDARQ